MLNHKNSSLLSIQAMTVGLVLSTSLASAAFASDAIGPGDSDSKWVLGVHTGALSNPFVDEDTEYFIVPNIEYRGDRLFLKDGELGYRFYSTSGLSFGALLTGNDSFLSDDDDYEGNRKLAGLKERDGTLDLGLYFIHTTDMGRLKLTLLDEITGEHGGQSADINYTFDLKYLNWNINPVIGANWTSRDSVDHFFGVSAEEANEYRKAYDGKSAVNLYAGIRGRYEITENWDINLGAGFVQYGSGIKDSTLIEDSNAAVASIGINYNF